MFNEIKADSEVTCAADGALSVLWKVGFLSLYFLFQFWSQ